MPCAARRHIGGWSLTRPQVPPSFAAGAQLSLLPEPRPDGAGRPLRALLRRPLELPISSASITLYRSIWSGCWQTSFSHQVDTGLAGELTNSYQCDTDRPGPLFLDRGLELLLDRLRSWAWSLDDVESF